MRVRVCVCVCVRAHLYRCCSSVSSVALLTLGRLWMKVEYFFTLWLSSSSSAEQRNPSSLQKRNQNLG